MKTIRISAGARENYDLMLNSGDLGIEKCVELICQAVK